MKRLTFSKAEFLHSALDKNSFVSFKNDSGKFAPEVVIAGKSNVGKSSLINHLLNQKNLAYISSKPGKTKTINFFKIDNLLILLDFPGYGYAKQSNELKEQWKKNFDLFLNERSTIKLLLLLVDCRRDISSDDLLFYKWAESKNIPCGVILTKCDKVKKNEIELAAKKLKTDLLNEKCISPKFIICYSTIDPISRKILISEINIHLGDI